MAKKDGETIIKKYANRRLYNTGTSNYVTLDDLARMIKNGDSFQVVDARSSENITHSILTQIVMEQEVKSATPMLPTSFLRQLICYNGEPVAAVVPAFLDGSIKAFEKQQNYIQVQMKRAFGDKPLSINLEVPVNEVDGQIVINTNMYPLAMSKSYSIATQHNGVTTATGAEIEELKAELQVLQTKLEKYS